MYGMYLLQMAYPMFDCAWLLTCTSTMELVLLARASKREARVSGVIWAGRQGNLVRQNPPLHRVQYRNSPC